MKKLLLVVLVAAGCSGSPVAPSPAATSLPAPSPAGVPRPTGFAGEWSGTTLTGERIAFTVSAEQKVTAITIEYRFGGCSGTRTFTGLTVEILTPAGTPPMFQHRVSDADSRNLIAVDGAFDSSEQVTGLTGFNDFMTCGSSLSLWRASRR